MKKNWNFETKCVQEGYEAEVGQPRILPINQTVGYKFEKAEDVSELFDLKRSGHMYSRISNPTVEALEKKYTTLEYGVESVATSSGHSAILLAILNICKAGDHILSSSNIYGGTHNLFEVTLKKYNIEVSFFDPNSDEETIIKSAKENTKVLFGETIGNPSLNVLDFDKFKSISDKLDIPFIVDNTVASPYNCNPVKYGANVVIHSTTKYSEGHATSVGGIIIDCGNFNWDNGKFDELVEPDLSYHGIRYWNTFKERAYITKLRVQLLRDFGCCMSPFNAFLTNLGLETLHLRMERHNENALKLAKWLSKHEKVAWVNYPGLQTDTYHELSKKYLPYGASGVLTFGIKGGYDEAKRFIEKLRLANLVITLGDVRTYVLHPSSTTHKQLSEEEQIECGVSKELIRVSVGIENCDDIIKDFRQGLEG